MRKTTNTIGQWECHRFLCGPLGISILLRGYKFSLAARSFCGAKGARVIGLPHFGQGTRAPGRSGEVPPRGDPNGGNVWRRRFV